MENVAEAGCKDGCGGGVEGLKLSVGADVDEVHLQSRGQKLAIEICTYSESNVPK